MGPARRSGGFALRPLQERALKCAHCHAGIKMTATIPNNDCRVAATMSGRSRTAWVRRLPAVLVAADGRRALRRTEHARHRTHRHRSGCAVAAAGPNTLAASSPWGVWHSRVRFAAHVVGEGEAFYEAAKASRLEGIIAKLRRSRYEPGKRTKRLAEAQGPARAGARGRRLDAGGGERPRPRGAGRSATTRTASCGSPARSAPGSRPRSARSCSRSCSRW